MDESNELNMETTRPKANKMIEFCCIACKKLSLSIYGS